MKSTRSVEMTQLFAIYPAGHNNFRIPMEVSEHRMFIKRTEGSRVWDEEDNEYIDPYFIRFVGHYHGWLDNVIGGQLNTDSEGKPFPFENPDSELWEDPFYTRGKGLYAPS